MAIPGIGGPITEKFILRIVGTGAVASVTINGAAYTLNQNVALVSGSLYEFAIHARPNDVIGVSGVSVSEILQVPVVD